MDRYAVIMYHVCTGDHEIYDIWEGDRETVLMHALDQAIHETTSCNRPIVLDVNEMIADSGITAVELAELMASRP